MVDGDGGEKMGKWWGMEVVAVTSFLADCGFGGIRLW